MRWELPQPGGAPRPLRLAYCLNLGAPTSRAELIADIDRTVAPLAREFGAPFGAGLYLPGRLALELAERPDEIDRLADALGERGLEPFTWNAFPYGGFQTDGLKERVFRPAWDEPERARYTRAVARVAVRVAQRLGCAPAPRHVSISTHAGGHGPAHEAVAVARAHALGAAAADLARLEDESGVRCVLAVEPEPRSSANDTLDWRRERALRRRNFLAGAAVALGRDRERAEHALERHLGLCLDACHSAVEFETAEDALATARAAGPLGKLQYSSALSLRDPGRDSAGRERFLALDEPRFLHQVTGRGPGGLLRAGDLAEVGEALADGDEAWLACDEWRCHFHVPLDRERLEGVLDTTREHAATLLRGLLADPTDRGTDELHVELETYTWSVLPPAPGRAPGAPPGATPAALRAEYASVIAVLEAAGARRSPGAEKPPPGR